MLSVYKLTQITSYDLFAIPTEHASSGCKYLQNFLFRILVLHFLRTVFTSKASHAAFIHTLNISFYLNLKNLLFLDSRD